jgi:hypothetical protein
MSTDLVGPLPTITFHGGPRAIREPGNLPKTVYLPPKNTMDPRFLACTYHHPACDCREAEMAENLAEWRHEYQALKAIVLRHAEGHRIDADWTYRQVFDRWENGVQVWRYERDDQALCSCVACQIAREAYIS